MPAFSVNKDQTVVRYGSEVVSLGLNDFKDLIRDKRRCVLCAQPSKRNREHVIPDWLLKRHKLHKLKIRLPRGKWHTFGTYKIPLCVMCNDKMGEELEAPISIIFKQGYDSVRALADGGDPRLYAWMCFLKFKTHYKDTMLRVDPDKRAGDEMLGDHLDWEKLHREHAIARSFIFGGRLMPSAVGSMAAFRISDAGKFISFNYHDEFDFACSLIRDSDTALICSFNDLGASNYLLKGRLTASSVTFYQLLAIFSEFETAVRRMYGAWQFDAEFDPADGSYLLENVVTDVIGFRPLPEEFRRNGLRYVFENYFQGLGQKPAIYGPLIEDIVLGKLNQIESVLVQPNEPSVYLSPNTTPAETPATPPPALR